jgi:poly(A) polymerase
MVPLVVPRAGHSLSRRDIDPDALKVLYRLKEAGFKAYLVGGGVRDLLLARRPKDFDIGTSAHPYQVKKLFKNCFIIGRRFRLAHVKFGSNKVIEVATFRRQVTAEETAPAEAAAAEASPSPEHGHLVHRDNSFGTDEEDAFRRDFTVNALFYDISTFSIIDYVGGLEDLRARVIRSIGDPDLRFREDPVRMQRAVSFAARLDFSLDTPVAQTIARLGANLALAAPARLMDEYHKILRSGAAQRTFAALREAGLLGALSRVLDDGAAADALPSSLARLDAYRQAFDTVPESLTNAILLGSLVVPLGFSPAGWPAWLEQKDRPGLNLGVVPLARRDLERMHQILMLQRRLREPSRSASARRMLMQRGAFGEALTWLEIHGNSPELLAFWREQVGTPAQSPAGQGPRRRRRRSGRRRPRKPDPTP